MPAEDDPVFPGKKQSSSTVIAMQTGMKFKQKEGQRRAKKKGKDDKKKESGSNYTTNVQFKDNDELCKEYQTSLEDGLTVKKAAELLEQFGPNELTPPPSLPWYVKLLQAIFGGFFNQLLWGGSILCFVAYAIDPAEVKDKSYLYLGIVLAVVVTLTGIFGYYQEAKSDDIMEGFKNLAPEDVNVWRDGKQQRIAPRELVPGDIIEVRYGSKLPADVRIMQCTADMEVDNASLTGEADPQKRQFVPSQDPDTLPQEAKNLAFFGTNMLKGTGKGLVYLTGDKTFMGSIAKMASETVNVETPIAKEIKGFVFKVSLIAFALGISFFIIGMVKTQGDIVPMVVFLIGIIVANVPEGLLATVTVSLTLTARRMAQKNVRVKNLESVETLGSTSVICSDKTGTLTTSIMTVQHVMFDMDEVLCDTADPEHANNGDFYENDGQQQLASFKRLLRIGVLCNNSEVIVSEKTGRKSYTSDPTEQAIFKFTLGNLEQLLSARGQSAKSIRGTHYPQAGESAAIPFNSSNKWQVSVHAVETSDACISKEENVGDSLVAIKGAPERILGMCDYYVYRGEKRKLDEKAREDIRELNSNLAKRGERVLGFADQLLDGKHYDRSVSEPDFNHETMEVSLKSVPQGQGSDKNSLYVSFEGKEHQISMKDCVHQITGENYSDFNKIGIIAVKEALARETGVPAGMQRLFGYDFSKQNNAELSNELSVKDSLLPGGSRLIMARGPYRFQGTSAKDANWPMEGFTFVGYFAMIDPPRASVPTAVLKCQAAGIKVVMVTGDHPTTAEAIAKQVHIIPEVERLPDGSTRPVRIGRWTTKLGQPPIIPEDCKEEDWQGVVVAGWKLQEELDKAIDNEDHAIRFWDRVLSMRKYCVFARTSPRQKLLIVQACQERGGIVAVTGDGVNDSPALKAADIGVAMGITGTEVAKDAADMILLDDNFASIVNGVEEGRIIFDNLKKSIAYTLSSNIPEIFPFLFNVLFGIPLPLTTVMILMVDLGTDLAPAISLAYEGKEADIMQRPPRDPLVDNLVTWRLVSFSYLQIGILQAIAGFFAYFVVLYEYGISYKYLLYMDDAMVFDKTSQREVRNYAYFMWCFEHQDGAVAAYPEYPCAYTPKQWMGDWYNWGDGTQSVGRKNLYVNNFGLKSEDGTTPAPWYACAENSSEASTCTDMWYNPNDESQRYKDWAENSNVCAVVDGVNPCKTGWADVPVDLKATVTEHQKKLFASMVCKWLYDEGNSGRVGCEYGGVEFFSTGTDAKVSTAQNARYANRYCQRMDLDGDDWSQFSETNSVQKVIRELNGFDDPGALCTDLNLTPAGTGVKNTIYPFQHKDRHQALAKSNTAYFISIIIVQWADLMICKTRSRSLFEQGMTNVFMNWSLLFETILGACFCYVAFANDMLTTLPLDFVWWLPAVPFSLAIYAYDEIRKGWIRHHRGGWLEYNTYW
jgi:magnesium-transporting ATPase (P-type)